MQHHLNIYIHFILQRRSKQFASSIFIVMKNICAFHAYAKQQVTERVLHLLTGPEKPCTWNTQTQV